MRLSQEIPESEMEGESDSERWFFETQRQAWEQEQREEDASHVEND
jgi:hypothetical protein